MSRYFFHIQDSSGMVPDDEGAEFSNIEAAREEARASARDLLAEMVKCGSPVAGRRVDVADEDGRVLASIPLVSLMS